MGAHHPEHLTPGLARIDDVLGDVPHILAHSQALRSYLLWPYKLVAAERVGPLGQRIGLHRGEVKESKAT